MKLIGIGVNILYYAFHISFGYAATAVMWHTFTPDSWGWMSDDQIFNSCVFISGYALGDLLDEWQKKHCEGRDGKTLVTANGMLDK